MSDSHFVLRFHAYSGMYYDMECDDDHTAVRKAAAKHIRTARKSQPVQTLKRGREWEFETPETAFMIGDGDGIMTIVEVIQESEDEEIYFSEEDLDELANRDDPFED